MSFFITVMPPKQRPRALSKQPVQRPAPALTDDQLASEDNISGTSSSDSASINSYDSHSSNTSSNTITVVDDFSDFDGNIPAAKPPLDSVDQDHYTSAQHSSEDRTTHRERPQSPANRPADRSARPVNSDIDNARAFAEDL